MKMNLYMEKEKEGVLKIIIVVKSLITSSCF